MRILFFGSTQGTACALHYFTSFVRLGHQVVPYDPGFFQADNAVERWVARLRKGPSPAKVSRVSAELVNLCRRNQFDLVFVMAENFLSKEALDEVRSLPGTAPLFLYHSHDNNFSDGILKPASFFETLAGYDFAFTTKSQNVARYQALGQKNAYFIPSAFEPTVHHPVSPSQSRLKQDYDVTFVGTFDHSRDAYLQAADWKRLHVWGGLWERWEKFDQHRDRITPRPIYYFEFADVMSRSRCALGLLRDEAQDLHTQRTFEIPACGALQIAPRNSEILSFFDEGKEIVCFDTPEELKSQLDFYLSHETARKKVAKAGHERCLGDKHAYEDRVQEIITIATGKKARRWAVGA